MAVYDRKRESHPDLALPIADYSAATSRLNAYGSGGGTAPSALARANGLSDAENRILFDTASLDEIVHLIMKGLGRVFGGATPK